MAPDRDDSRTRELNETLRGLVRAVSGDPVQALATLVDAARKLSGASSAGVTLGDRWHTVAGPLPARSSGR